MSSYGTLNKWSNESKKELVETTRLVASIIPRTVEKSRLFERERLRKGIFQLLEVLRRKTKAESSLITLPSLGALGRMASAVLRLEAAHAGKMDANTRKIRVVKIPD